MSENQSAEITQLLRSWQEGNRDALDQLTPLVYEELHRRARHYMAREQDGHILQTTALINEVYLRLVRVNLEWKDRAHFYAVCAQMMRRILTDFARSRGYQKRGGDVTAVNLEEAMVVSPSVAFDIVALEQVLSRLEEIDMRKGKVVELRFFGGLTVEETAEVLNVSPDTVMRDWGMARAWLMRELHGGTTNGARTLEEN
jgi:RNA polymerase sigma-70 factor, ECF subfamily